jgi:hypothetical protein
MGIDTLYSGVSRVVQITKIMLERIFTFSYLFLFFPEFFLPLKIFMTNQNVIARQLM